jgi:hypothetical protein
MELATMLFAKFVLGIDLEDYVNKSALNNIIITLPERIIQYGFLFSILYKKNSILNELKYIEILRRSKQIINKNKMVSKILFVTRIIIIASFLIIARLIVYQHIMLSMPLKYQLIIILFLLIPLSIPVLTTAIAVSILKDQMYNEQFGKEVNHYDKQDS